MAVNFMVSPVRSRVELHDLAAYKHVNATWRRTEADLDRFGVGGDRRCRYASAPSITASSQASAPSARR